jgi:DivIVA domain-containing protein
MREILLLLVVALVAAAIVFGVAAIITGGDPGLQPSEPDDRFRTLPGDRPLSEEDITVVRFDTAIRGYRMEQVDRAMSRIGYDLGYKDELIRALEAEVNALREGRDDEADVLRDRRLAAAGITPERLPAADPEPVGQTIDLGEVPTTEPADDLADDVADDLADDREAAPARETAPAQEAAPLRTSDEGEPEEDADEAFAPRR